MKNSELYHKTVNILVNAYFNDTLEHANCYACAVGNIVAANCGISFVNSEKPDYRGRVVHWEGKSPYSAGPVQHFGLTDTATYWVSSDERMPKMPLSIMDQVLSTGYSVIELNEIEHAFEAKAQFSPDKDEFMFNGLMAVIDALDVIHENNDTKVTETSKSKFQKQTA